MQSLDIALLKNFIIVAQTGSISLAAQQVGRTQSALSMQMHRLEDQLGKPLLHRTGAGVRLTAAGEKLLVHAEALLTQHDEILMDMTGTTLRGSISLGCTEDYASAFLPQLLGSFCARYPDIDLRLACAPSTDLRPQLQQRLLDMALVSLPSAKADGVIRKEQLVWVANEAAPGDPFGSDSTARPAHSEHDRLSGSLHRDGGDQPALSGGLCQQQSGRSSGYCPLGPRHQRSDPQRRATGSAYHIR